MNNRAVGSCQQGWTWMLAFLYMEMAVGLQLCWTAIWWTEMCCDGCDCRAVMAVMDWDDRDDCYVIIAVGCNFLLLLKNWRSFVVWTWFNRAVTLYEHGCWPVWTWLLAVAPVGLQFDGLRYAVMAVQWRMRCDHWRWLWFPLFVVPWWSCLTYAQYYYYMWYCDSNHCGNIVPKISSVSMFYVRILPITFRTATT